MPRSDDTMNAASTVTIEQLPRICVWVRETLRVEKVNDIGCSGLAWKLGGNGRFELSKPSLGGAPTAFVPGHGCRAEAEGNPEYKDCYQPLRGFAHGDFSNVCPTPR